MYEFLEFLSTNDEHRQRNETLQFKCNQLFEKEGSGYRFIDGIIAPITSDEEINEIEKAIRESTKEVQNHLDQSPNFIIG